MSTLGGFGNGIKNPFGFDVNKSISDLSSKVIVVTGGNAGVGKESVLQFAKHNPKRLYLAARSQAKFDAAAKDIKAKVPNAKLDFLKLDLASFASVKQAAEQVIAENDRLDILMNNAGIMGAPYGKTSEGYEVHFGTNHMGHALLTRLLLPMMEKSAEEPNSDVRIVNVASTGQNMAPGIDFDEVKTDGSSRHSFVLYGISKLANVIHAKQLAKRYPKILTVSIHPGRVNTSLLSDYSKKGSFAAKFQRVYDFVVGVMTLEDGALSQLWAATWAKKDIENGCYYTPVGYKGRVAAKAKDENLADRLWDWQDEEFKRLGFA